MNPPPKSPAGALESLARRLEKLEGDSSAKNELLVLINERTRRIQEDINAMRGDFVKKEEFDALRATVKRHDQTIYAVVAFVFVALGGALLNIVLIKK